MSENYEGPVTDLEIVEELFPSVVIGAANELDAALSCVDCPTLSDEDSEKFDVAAEQIIEWLDTDHARAMFLDYLERTSRRLGVR